MAKYEVACVRMWGKTLGELCYDDSHRTYAFRYEPSWIDTQIEISPLEMPLSDRTYRFPELPLATFRGLPGVFADSLPDAFGNAVIDAWLAHTHREHTSLSALERLLFIGTRGMGALEYTPVMECDLNECKPLKISDLVAMAQWVLDRRAGVQQPFDSNHNETLRALVQTGSSAGGARPKIVIGINHDRTEICRGHTAVPAGYEHYLLKFDGVVEPLKSNEAFGDPQGFGRMEYAYFLMAKAAGITISPCELLVEGERAHFITKRFDRNGNRKVHCQSLCAMNHADFQQPGRYDYEQIFNTLRRLNMPHTEVLELYRRMVFNIIARNHDDHAKNFGFILNQNHQWRLAPAFDIAYSYTPGSKWINTHQRALNGKRDHFTRKDLLAPAQHFHNEAIQIIEKVKDAVAQWPRYAKEAGVFSHYAEEIQSGHRLEI